MTNPTAREVAQKILKIISGALMFYRGQLNRAVNLTDLIEKELESFAQKAKQEALEDAAKVAEHAPCICGVFTKSVADDIKALAKETKE